MDIYLAAAWSERKRMRDVAEHLQALGIGVTSHWIYSDRPTGMGPEDIEADPAPARIGCFRDLQGINMADRVAVFTDAPSTTGGLHVEYGYALSREKYIDIIGPRLNVFYSIRAPGVRHFADTVSWFDRLHEERKS